MIVASDEDRARHRREGWWGETRLIDLFDRNVRDHADDEALVDPPNRAAIVYGAPRRLTWAQIRDEVADMAVLFHNSGLRRGDIVLVQLPNIVECVMVYLAALRLGLVLTPAPMQYREKELAQIIRATGASAAVGVAVFKGEDSGARIVGLADGLAKRDCVFILGEGVGGDIDMCARLAAVDPQDRQAVAEAEGQSADDVLTICWTSGTEAEPKGVPRCDNEWLMVSRFIRSALRPPARPRILVSFPMVNVSGLAVGFTSWLDLAGTVVLHHPFDLDLYIEQLDAERIDLTIAAPAILARLAQQPERLEGVDLSNLRRIGSGSAPVAAWIIEAWRDRYGIDLINLYGSNEGAGLAATAEEIPEVADRALYFPRYGAPGAVISSPVSGSASRERSAAAMGKANAAPGRAGELRMRGPTIFSGYWNAPELTAAAFDDQGWYRTGDLFEITGEKGQFYRYAGRLKDIVLRGGMNISCQELEDCLGSHPAVREVAVIGAPDPVLGERVCACITAEGPPPDMETLNRHLREERQVALYKQIERLELFDGLPRNPLGKVVKRALREAVSERMKREAAA